MIDYLLLYQAAFEYSCHPYSKQEDEEERLFAPARVPSVFRPTPRLSPECSRLMEMLGIAAQGGGNSVMQGAPRWQKSVAKLESQNSAHLTQYQILDEKRYC